MFDDYQKIRRRVEAAKTARDRAKGALDELMGRLRKEFGCNTVGEAEALLEKLKREEVTLAGKYVKARAAFLKAWKDKVGDDE